MIEGVNHILHKVSIVKPTTTGWDPEHIARAWVVLMKRLGYRKFVARRVPKQHKRRRASEAELWWSFGGKKSAEPHDTMPAHQRSVRICVAGSISNACFPFAAQSVRACSR